MVITKTNTVKQTSEILLGKSKLAALLLASSPPGVCTVDRCAVTPPFTVGRSSDCELTIRDSRASKQHMRITGNDGGFEITDLDSTNGTYLNGTALGQRQPLPTDAVIRLGETVLTFHTDAEELLNPSPLERFGMVGRFFVGAVLRVLDEAALSGRHVLLAGPSGAGKELGAKALASMMGSPSKKLPLLAYNAARFTSEDEATATLFGVGRRVFSGVDSRAGLIEQAHGGLLFLDEVHNLPERVQRTLLRVIEDGVFTRIGETLKRNADVRFVLASNARGPSFSLAHDLFARLRVVQIPALRDRAADIPSIFDHVLRKRLAEFKLNSEEIMPCIRGEYYETLCLDGFPNDNVRGVKDLADRIATRIAKGSKPAKAMADIFIDRFGIRVPIDQEPPAIATVDELIQSPSKTNEAKQVPEVEEDESLVSIYEKHKALILSTYEDREKNISATERLLKNKGIKCSRRWLKIYLDKWLGEES
ncbi:MAG: FHA domain-containing protein [Proteobacteria bacterium]|nr:FHA domain-containing protein [Pseudomonadota bacterium]